MKRITLAWSFVICIAANAAAQAPVARMGEIAVGGGVSFPVDEDFRDSANTGLLLDLRGGYYATPQHVVGAEFAWVNHAASDALESAVSAFVGFPVDASFDFFQIGAYFKYLFTPKRISPYVKVHAGIYRLRTNVEALGESDSDSQNDLGLDGGFGLQSTGNGVIGGFVEGIWHVDFTEQTATSFATLQAGVQLFLGGKRAP